MHENSRLSISACSSVVLGFSNSLLLGRHAGMQTGGEGADANLREIFLSSPRLARVCVCVCVCVCLCVTDMHLNADIENCNQD